MISISGEIRRSANILTMSYVISGALSDVALPGPAERPMRADRLWEETCMEFFLAPAGLDKYWEFNLSPSGHWSVYSFESYRTGMKEEAAFRSLPFLVSMDRTSLVVSPDLPLDCLVPEGQALDVAICAVIKKTDDEKSHWALVHHGARPDFHGRDGFIIRI